LLLQKLKKYELPDLPAPRHDPELLTAEQLQAYKKIGFRNRNYVPVGVRGVFGGVVQNMHMHWKFHETVQVCCDNFPKEKIKEMAAMLTRLSGGIVINIHNTKTIIMFRGRNYRQPKNLIPFNTLTKRKVSPLQLMCLSQLAFPCYFYSAYHLLWITHVHWMAFVNNKFIEYWFV
jgi:RNA-binding protein YhbY